MPESPWLGGETPAKPEVSARRSGSGVAIEMKLPRSKSALAMARARADGRRLEDRDRAGRENRHVVRT